MNVTVTMDKATKLFAEFVGNKDRIRNELERFRKELAEQDMLAPVPSPSKVCHVRPKG